MSRRFQFAKDTRDDVNLFYRESKGKLRHGKPAACQHVTEERKAWNRDLRSDTPVPAALRTVS